MKNRYLTNLAWGAAYVSRYSKFVINLSLIFRFLVAQNLWKRVGSVRENSLYVVSNQYFPTQSNAPADNLAKNEGQLSLYYPMMHVTSARVQKDLLTYLVVGR